MDNIVNISHGEAEAEEDATLSSKNEEQEQSRLKHYPCKFLLPCKRRRYPCKFLLPCKRYLCKFSSRNSKCKSRKNISILRVYYRPLQNERENSSSSLPRLSPPYLAVSERRRRPDPGTATATKLSRMNRIIFGQKPVNQRLLNRPEGNARIEIHFSSRPRPCWRRDEHVLRVPPQIWLLREWWGWSLGGAAIEGNKEPKAPNWMAWRLEQEATGSNYYRDGGERRRPCRRCQVRGERPDARRVDGNDNEAPRSIP
uniref:Uncharacterized protein n=1 Tax=Oryza sativa subsp. japonica TaxID=39947 RepID=Q5ZA42_ORYSJ|nr:hypothetical protein [Oryza sativa Japonica Group]